MEENFDDSTLQPKSRSWLDAKLVNIDLPLYIRRIKEESAWKDRKRNAMTVFKTNAMRIVLIDLHEGAEMARHIADGVITLQVLEGKLQFNTDQQALELDNGQC